MKFEKVNGHTKSTIHEGETYFITKDMLTDFVKENRMGEVDDLLVKMQREDDHGTDSALIAYVDDMFDDNKELTEYFNDYVKE